MHFAFFLERPDTAGVMTGRAQKSSPVFPSAINANRSYQAWIYVNIC